MSLTPGPWEIDESQILSCGWAKICAPNADGLEFDLPVIVGKVYASENFKQDAELVAAAPDLLEACELVAAFYTMPTKEFVERFGYGISTRDVGEKARAAIKKARGES